MEAKAISSRTSQPPASTWLALTGELPPVLAIIAVLWVGNFLHFTHFGLYEDDWYFFGVPYGGTWQNSLRYTMGQLFFQGRPFQVFIQGVIGIIGASIGSLPMLYLATFILSACKAVLCYFTLRIRFTCALSLFATILFVISPLTTINQFLNGELTIAPAYTFLFLAILLYCRRRILLSYLFAACALFTYESIFLLFLAAPLFRSASSSRSALTRIARHAGICFGLLVTAMALRRHFGESRAVWVGIGDTVKHLAIYDLSYTIQSFKLYIYGCYVGIRGISVEWIIYACLVIVPILWYLWRDLETERPESEDGRVRGSAGTGALLGACCVVLGYGLSYFVLNGVSSIPFAGRDTRISSAATFGSSLLFASFSLWLIQLTRGTRLRQIGAALVGLIVLVLFSYTLVIQEDYIRVWAKDRSTLSQIVALTPDVQADTAFVVREPEIVPSLFGTGERSPSIGYQRHGLQDSLWALMGWGVAPHIFFVHSDEWIHVAKLGSDGLVHSPELMRRQWDGPVTPGRVVAFTDVGDGRLVRADHQATVDGKPILQLLDLSNVAATKANWKIFRSNSLALVVLDPVLRSNILVNTDALKETLRGNEPVIIPAPVFRAGSVTWEAEQFASGTGVVTDTNRYGAGIGVIVSGTVPTSVEYAVPVSEAGRYEILIRYASNEPRPVTLRVNGAFVTGDACSAVTGGWGPYAQQWQRVGVVDLHSGTNRFRLERGAGFPHIDKLAITPLGNRPVMIPDPILRPGGVMWEAESFASTSGGRVDTSTYGAGIGVFVSGSVPTSVDYGVAIGHPGKYELLIRYASDGVRPVTVRVNGVLVAVDACSTVTGGWGPWAQKWQRAAIVNLQSGRNAVRLERAEGFPHIDKLAVNPVVQK